jgi:ribonuclease HI
MRPYIQIVTDGSAIGNPGPGGWAAIFNYRGRRWRLSGSAQITTASEMELTAAIEALRSLHVSSQVTLCSDSEYLIRGMRYLADRWETQGWLNSRGAPLRDREYWKYLLRLRDLHTIRWQWVRGHDGHPSQVEADALAYWEARHNGRELRVAG